jgi:hypothetical protein
MRKAQAILRYLQQLLPEFSWSYVGKKDALEKGYDSAHLYGTTEEATEVFLSSHGEVYGPTVLYPHDAGNLDMTRTPKEIALLFALILRRVIQCPRAEGTISLCPLSPILSKGEK